MPLEQATYIKDLQPDWPLGTDPESAGDDHIRMVKQVQKNTLPNLDAPVTGNPAQLNNLTDSMEWDGASTDPVIPAHWSIYDPEQRREGVSVTGLVAMGPATVAQFNQNPNIALTWLAVQNIFYPVGSEFKSYTDNRNPADILGFGTWAPIVGLIAGVGMATDSQGYAGGYDFGYQAGSWRVQNSQIVANQLILAMDAVPDHEHSYSLSSANNDTDTNGGGATTYELVEGSTGPAGGHTPSGSVTIGAAGATEGYSFHNPYYGCYIWTRTA